MFNKYKGYLAKDVLLAGLLLFTLFPEKMDRLQKPEPGKKIKVFLLAGQSNMEGRANARKLSPEDDKRLLRTRNNVRLAYNYEPLGPLQPVKPSPEIAGSYKRDLIFGPELFFGITLSEAWPQEKILLIKRTEGGTSLYGCWNPDWREDKAAVMGEDQEPALYSAFTDYVRQILSEYKKDAYEICAMLWVQGETDSGNEIAAAAYGRNLEQLIRHVRQDVGNENLPFLLFQVGSGKVVDGMKKTAQHLPNVFLLPQSTDPASTDYYPRMENGHYNYEGMKKLGQRFAEVFLNRSKEAE